MDERCFLVDGLLLQIYLSRKQGFSPGEVSRVKGAFNSRFGENAVIRDDAAKAALSDLLGQKVFMSFWRDQFALGSLEFSLTKCGARPTKGVVVHAVCG